MTSSDKPDIVIIGAGPAGLTAAYELGKRDHTSTVLEADDTVGGISRTVLRDGWRFDIGGHRFFTKVTEVEDLWHEILPQGDFLLRPRLSRIFYNGKYFDYPLKAMNALRNLGIIEAIRCVLSYIWVRIKRPETESFEGWVASRFGWRLYRTFFKTYTEKVWGVPPTRSRPTSPHSGSRTCRCSKRWSTCCSPTATKKRSPPSSRSSSTPSTVRG